MCFADEHVRATVDHALFDAPGIGAGKMAHWVNRQGGAHSHVQESRAADDTTHLPSIARRVFSWNQTWRPQSDPAPARVLPGRRPKSRPPAQPDDQTDPVAMAVRNLEPRLRCCACMKHLKGMTLVEIAATLRISHAAAMEKVDAASEGIAGVAPPQLLPSSDPPSCETCDFLSKKAG
jgi:hypothetical protein